jgi:hypothetical protein
MFMTLAEGESIHSFLLRVLLCAGYLESTRDLIGIVSPAGVVRTLPRLDRKQSKCFADVGADVFDNGISRHLPSFCQLPSILTELRAFILGLRVPALVKDIPFSRTQLRYCVDCFKEQIDSCGHTWFKTAWLYDYDCEKHSKRLSHAYEWHHRCCDTQLNTLTSIKSSLSGICPNCNCSDWGFSGIVSLPARWTANYYLLEDPKVETYSWCDLVS